jgi:hypothetical protein
MSQHYTLQKVFKFLSKIYYIIYTENWCHYLLTECIVSITIRLRQGGEGGSL